ncbi:MAG: CHASE3 domain-containing protein [Geminicoccaceae bacterium]
MLLANGLFFYNSHVRLAAATRDVAESVDARQLLSELLTVLLGAESGHRGFILTDEASNLAPYNAALQQADELLGRIGPLLQADAPQMQRLAIVRALVAERFRELSRTLDARRQQGAEAARRLIRDNQQLGTLDELRRVVGEMQDVEAVTLDTRRADWEEARFHAFAAFVVFLTVSAALVAALFGFMRREVVDRIAYNRRLKAYADELGASLAELRTERNEIAQLAVASTCLQSCEALGELPAVLPSLLEPLFPAHGGAVFARAAAGEGLGRIAGWGGVDQPDELETGDCLALGQGREHRHGIQAPAAWRVRISGRRSPGAMRRRSASRSPPMARPSACSASSPSRRPPVLRSRARQPRRSVSPPCWRSSSASPWPACGSARC